MTKSIENLLNNSGLPGPRANLALLHSFSKTATEEEIKKCLSFCTDGLHNSPEEFVVMCGIVGYCIQNQNNIPLKELLQTIRKYASHSSWRIREAVAIGIQEIAANRILEVITNLKEWINGNAYEKRAVIATLCELKLLTAKDIIIKVLEILLQVTIGFNEIKGKLSDSEISLRKTLGYGWSVAIVSLPDEGKEKFEKIAKIDNKHIQWIVKENLKKHRLMVMDKIWVEKILHLTAMQSKGE